MYSGTDASIRTRKAALIHWRGGQWTQRTAVGRKQQTCEQQFGGERLNVGCRLPHGHSTLWSVLACRECPELGPQGGLLGRPGQVVV